MDITEGDPPIASRGRVDTTDPNPPGSVRSKERPSPPDRSVAVRWTEKLASAGYSPVPSYFLKNYHRLRPHAGADGLTSTEAMIILQIMDFRWDARAPFPTVTTIAKQMGLQARTVRAAIARMESLKYIRRQLAANGGPNRYHFDGLFAALDALYDEDVKKADEQKKEGA